MKSLAVMQPYLFPYLGYFQLVGVVDKFVFYDDVNYINRGWVNRNRILINGQPQYITVQLVKASQNKLINEIEIGDNIDKILSTISMAYKKSPFFGNVFPVIEECFKSGVGKISELTIKSVITIAEYLELDTKFEISSIHYPDTKGLEKADRLIAICNKAEAGHYINAIGGMELYDKPYFRENNVKLDFLKARLKPYKQFNNEFVNGLSIIDILMFNDIDVCREMVLDYQLV